METGTILAIGGLALTMIGGFWGVIKYLLAAIASESSERKRINEKLFDICDTIKASSSEELREIDKTIDDVRDRLIRVETIQEERTPKK